MEKIYCPDCRCAQFHPYEDRYECDSCGRLFDEEDIEREELRHQLSPMLDGTSEEKPMEIYFVIPTAEEEACGLSSLLIPHIDKVFEMEGDGTIWYHEDGEYENPFPNRERGEKPVLLWRDIDELELADLRALVDYIREEL